jgi:hypothetical protein
MASSKGNYRRNRTVALGSIVDTVLAKYKLFDGVFLARIATEKEEIFGPFFSVHLTPTEYKEGRLTLRVDNDAWRHEAELCKSELLQRLAEYAPGKVRKIFFV